MTFWQRFVNFGNKHDTILVVILPIVVFMIAGMLVIGSLEKPSVLRHDGCLNGYPRGNPWVHCDHPKHRMYNNDFCVCDPE
jgi:hypothetical protein